MARTTKRQAPPREQTEIPGTEQERDRVLETEGAKLQAIKQEIAEHNKRKAEIEARIHKRFGEFDEDDPRRVMYRIKTGEILRPTLKPQLKITRPRAVAADSDDEGA